MLKVGYAVRKDPRMLLYGNACSDPTILLVGWSHLVQKPIFFAAMLLSHDLFSTSVPASKPLES